MPGRKLGRKTDHRLSMLRGQVTFLLENGRLETTVTRAKEVRSLAEKMITIGKKNTLAARRQAMSFITKEDVVKKLFDVIAPTFEGRNGGYTRIYLLGPRRGDAAEMAMIELIVEEKKEEKKTAKKKTTAKTATKTTTRKKAPAKTAAETPAEEPKTKETPAEETKTEETTAEEPKAEEPPATEAKPE